MQHSSDCFPLNDESSIDGVNEITLSWGDIGGEILYLISNSKKDAIGQLSNLGWIIVVFDVEGAGACENSGVVCISKLEEFPLVICGLNRKRQLATKL
nr:inositol 1,3,4-trisphosphate 5/6-kinase 4-like [Populus alba]